MQTFRLKANGRMNYEEIPTALYVVAIVVLFKILEWTANKLDHLWAGRSEERDKAQSESIKRIETQNEQILKHIQDMNSRLIANEKDYEHIVVKVREHTKDIEDLKEGMSELKNEIHILQRIITEN